MRLLSLLSLIILSFSALPVWAQEQPADDAQASQNPYDDIPDEFIAEAASYYNECATSYTQKNYYDCKCLASKYLDFRIEEGPTAPKSSILTRLTPECRDYTHITGQEYGECLRKTHNLPAGTDPEAYCACFVNTYISLLERSNPVIRSANLRPLKTRSAVACQTQQR